MTRTLAAVLSLAGVAAPGWSWAQGPLAVPGGAQVFDWREDGVYPVIAMPGRITDLVLQPGEALVGTGAIAAGDTARWVIGDTTSGAGEERRVHVLVKPTLSGLATNLIVNTDRRTYHVELRASARTWLSQVGWRYPARPVAPVLVAAPPAIVPPVLPVRINLAYRIKGDRPVWRPRRVFDDGSRTYVEFGPRADLAELPPLYLTGPDGKAAELVNYHVEERRLVLDRLFYRAELRLGIKRRAQRVVLVREASATEAGR